jgi:transposase
MKHLIPSDKPTIAALADRLKRATSHTEYQRIQCVLIRSTLGITAAQIAQLLGWSTATVHVIHSRWAKEGDALFDLHGRGGRHHQHLSAAEEGLLLAPFTAKAQAGGLLHASEIKQAIEKKVGSAVAPSTVYRMLNRHGWRKVIPMPHPPKADMRAQGTSKKTPPFCASRGWTPG